MWGRAGAELRARPGEVERAVARAVARSGERARDGAGARVRARAGAATGAGERAGAEAGAGVGERAGVGAAAAAVPGALMGAPVGAWCAITGGVEGPPVPPRRGRWGVRYRVRPPFRRQEAVGRPQKTALPVAFVLVLVVAAGSAGACELQQRGAEYARLVLSGPAAHMALCNATQGINTEICDVAVSCHITSTRGWLAPHREVHSRLHPHWSTPNVDHRHSRLVYALAIQPGALHMSNDCMSGVPGARDGFDALLTPEQAARTPLRRPK